MSFSDSTSAVCDCTTDCIGNCTAGQYFDTGAVSCIQCQIGH